MPRSHKTCTRDCRRVSCHTVSRIKKKTASVYQSTIKVTNWRTGRLVGVRRDTASSMPSRNVMIRNRSRTNNPNHVRSLKARSAGFEKVEVMLGVALILLRPNQSQSSYSLETWDG